MPFPVAETFRTKFLAFSRDEAVAFVADLWRARGWSVEERGGRLLLRQSTSGRVRTLYVLANSSDETIPDDADMVIVSTDAPRDHVPDDVESIDPATLYQMTKYAVESEERKRLLDIHFDDIQPETVASDDELVNTSENQETGANTNSVDSVASDESLDAVSEESSNVGLESNEDSTVETRANRDTVDRRTGDEATDSPDTDRVSRRMILLTSGALIAGIGSLVATKFSIDTEPPVEPPGLTDEGVVDPTALAEGHAAEIQDRSYALGLTVVVSDAERSLRSYLSMDLALAADRTYLTRVSTNGPEAPGFLGSPPATAVFWSDGDVYLSQFSPEETEAFTEFEPANGFAGKWQYWARTVPFGGTLQSRPEQYFQTIFDAIPTRLVERQRIDGTDRYRLANDGSQLRTSSNLNEPGVSQVRDARLDAVVDHRSVVRSFELQFVAQKDGDRVVFYRTVDYSALGETTVERPPMDG